MSTRIDETVLLPQNAFVSEKTCLSVPKRVFRRQTSVINPSGHRPNSAVGLTVMMVVRVILNRFQAVRPMWEWDSRCKNSIT